MKVLFQRYLSVGLLIFSTVGSLMAQTYSTEEVEIRGIQLSRFVVDLKASPQWENDPHSSSWKTALQTNLCWSSVFQVKGSQITGCKASRSGVDFQVLLDLEQEGSQRYVSLKVVSGDNPLMTQRFPVEKITKDSKNIIDFVNEMAKTLTGDQGVLGSTIAFVLKQPQYLKVIARVNTHGSDLQSVSRNKNISVLPHWNSDGSIILYTMLNEKGSRLVYDNLQQTPKILKLSEITASGGSWSADGKKIVASFTKSGNTDLYSIDFNKGSTSRVTNHAAIDTSPALSPDQKYLVFVSDRSGSEQIYLQSLEKQETFRLTFTGTRNTDPEWSPDGKWIAFTKTIGQYDQIYIMTPFGEEERSLTENSYHSEDPAWSPNGKQLVFSSNKTGEYKLYLLSVDGVGLRRLTNTPKGYEETSPSWTARSFLGEE